MEKIIPLVDQNPKTASEAVAMLCRNMEANGYRIYNPFKNDNRKDNNDTRKETRNYD